MPLDPLKYLPTVAVKEDGVEVSRTPTSINFTGGANVSSSGEEVTVDITGGEGGIGDLISTNNLSDVANEADSRDNLGLGDSATKDVGTGAGNVSAGNHNHSGVYEPADADIQNHLGDTANPHSVTKSQVGLANADNTSDANKPVSTATQTALNLKATEDVYIAQALGSSIKAQTVGSSIAWGMAANTTMADAAARYIAVYLPTAQTITGVKFYQITQGSYTADNNNYLALYTYSAGTLTQVAISANNGNLWKATANTLVAEPFTGTYAASAGLYFVGLLYNQSAQTTAPSLGAYFTGGTNSQAFDYTNSAKLFGSVAAQTTLPSSQLMSGVSGNNSFSFYVALY